jgi:protocatechuate 3,4-dioxygenase beta subunit
MNTNAKISMTILTAAATFTFFMVPAVGVAKCPPTEPDAFGPFYRPNAPVRSTIGRGFVLAGTVRSTADCRPVPKARIEVWHAGPRAEYDEAHRATLYSDARGNYRLVTDFPPPYLTRPSHIHILVEAPGFQRLITQHYPTKGAKAATFDLVLIPNR